ncbi:hypothetical protein TRICI_005895 [Trichomonascus ciferrii]|uniref:Cyclin-like domain-containing protein n=1 Tax=Trichomonascus ciferrii TaxID=44093 RepID=A0A642UP10_9ASCO|nr:hypothetical protein TRICI_005895 [Trichomonascus ciferrii]
MDNYCYNSKENLVLEHDYKDEILCHLRDLSKATRPDCNMINMQPELEWYMRPYLIDFIIECHQMMRLSPSTLFLTVNLIDRYASKRIIYKRHYQLVACSALWIASKYNHDDNVPTLNQLKTFSCNVYEPHMFIQMESHILNTLNWLIGFPTADLYLDMYLREDDDCIVRQLANYVCEVSLFHKQFLAYSSQEIARCAAKLSVMILKFHHESLNAPVDDCDQTCFNLLVHASTIPSEITKKKYFNCFRIVEDFFNSIKLQPPTYEPSYQPPRQQPSPVPSDGGNFDLHPIVTKTPPYERGYITPPFTPVVD